MQGYDGLNRAVDGDVVAVELLPEDQWSAPSEIILQNDDVDDEGNFFPFRFFFFHHHITCEYFILGFAEEIVEKVLKVETKKEKTPTGKIVGIIRRKWRQYCGILQHNALQNVSLLEIFFRVKINLLKSRM